MKRKSIIRIPIKAQLTMTLQTLKQHLAELKKQPTTSSVKGFFMDLNFALKNGEITKEEKEQFIKELKSYK